jgi:hypothetical protein
MTLMVQIKHRMSAEHQMGVGKIKQEMDDRWQQKRVEYNEEH